ncbi:MAG: prolyl oligopeptidase family serine peptidase, partial [Fuerstiella sp.]|nr:prolyl oligopeptidase family serine peptidase [Fuerstiella sp.]
MPRTASLLALASIVALSSPSFADGEKDNHPENVRQIPRAGIEVPADREAALRSGLTSLQQKIGRLNQAKDSLAKDLLPDVMIFERAVRCALDYDEFFSPKDIDKADQLIVEGNSRADQLLSGQAHWPNQSGLVVRGYISRIDHTVQPYGLVMPETYAFNHSVPTRCDLWFHGRGETLSEVNFLWDRMKNPGRYTPDHTIVLHPYGRYSNAFKFAGEVDVLEALEDAQRRYRIDEDRISVRGFSMGGAACWQFAVHYPDRWFAANPGAGFSETPQFLKFFQKETLNPTPWEKALWNLYDCDKYAVNLTYCPTVAYSGENDIQKQAADVMETALKEHQIRLRHVIGAKMGHRIDDVSMEIVEAGMDSLAKRGRVTDVTEVKLQTHTLKYNRMHWLTVDALQEHWQPSHVSAE